MLGTPFRRALASGLVASVLALGLTLTVVSGGGPARQSFGMESIAQPDFDWSVLFQNEEAAGGPRVTGYQATTLFDSPELGVVPVFQSVAWDWEFLSDNYATVLPGRRFAYPFAFVSQPVTATGQIDIIVNPGSTLMGEVKGGFERILESTPIPGEANAFERTIELYVAFAITGGTGRFAGASGSGSLYSSFSIESRGVAPNVVVTLTAVATEISGTWVK